MIDQYQIYLQKNQTGNLISKYNSHFSFVYRHNQELEGAKQLTVNVTSRQINTDLN